MTAASAVPSLSPASDTVAAAAASRSGRRRRGLGPYPDKFGSSTSELRAQVEMMAWPDPAVLRRRRLPVCPPLTSSFDSPLHWCPTAEEAHQPRRETRFRCCTLSSNLTSVRNSRAPLPRLQRHRLQVVVGEADGGGLQHGKVDEEAGLLAAGQLPASSKGLRRGLWAHGSLKDELFLKLVLEYVPETVHCVVKHDNKMNPLIYVKLYTHHICRALAYINGSIGVCHKIFWPLSSCQSNCN